MCTLLCIPCPVLGNSNPNSTRLPFPKNRPQYRLNTNKSAYVFLLLETGDHGVSDSARPNLHATIKAWMQNACPNGCPVDGPLIKFFSAKMTAWIGLIFWVFKDILAKLWPFQLSVKETPLSLAHRHRKIAQLNLTHAKHLVRSGVLLWSVMWARPYSRFQPS